MILFAINPIFIKESMLAIHLNNETLNFTTKEDNIY